MTKHTEDAQGRLVVHAARTADAVEELRPEWQRMQWHPNADIDFFLMIMQCRPEIVRPHVISLWSEGQCAAIAVCRIEATRMRLALGYKTLFQPKVRQITLIHGGLLGEQTAETSSAFLAEIMAVLQKKEADVAQFIGIANNEMREGILTRPSFLCRDHAPAASPHWTLSLPTSMDSYLEKFTRKRRHDMKRVGNQLERAYSGRVAMRVYEGAIDINEFCRDIEKVASKTYHRGINKGFADNEENRRRITLLAKKNCLRAYVMYIAQQPVAFWIGTVYGPTYFLNFTGYDPDFEKHEVGTISFLRMLEDLCRRADITALDFGSGDAFYKRKFCDSCSNETMAFILARTPKGITLGLLLFAFRGLSQSLSRLLARFDLKDRIKKMWRRRLIALRQKTSEPFASAGEKSELSQGDN